MRTLTQTGDVGWTTPLGRGSLEPRGPAHLYRALPARLKLSPFADLPV